MTSVQKISWSKEEIKLVADYLVKIANQSEERKMEIPIESETLKHEKVVEEAKMGIAEALITNEINEEALVEDQKIKEIMEFSQIPQPKTVKRIEEKIPEEKIDVIEEKRLEFEEDKTGIEEMGEIGFEEMGEIGFEKRTIEGEIVQEPIVEEKVQEPIVEEKVQEPIVEEKVQEPIVEEKVQEPIVEEKVETDILSLAKEIGKALTQTETTEDISIVQKIETEDLSAEVVTEPILDKPVEIKPEDFPEDIRDIALEEMAAQLNQKK
ncbi:MAG: hypothetical protein ACTSSL_11925 [Candidatus Heimdallarchaeaceae archaeon]